ncbi:MAG: FHA domain-containing protein [Phycisphaerales bacterium]
MASLTIINGASTGRHFVLGHRTLSIGRDPARDIQLCDPKVSRKHALIRCEGEEHVLSPARALNGVLINGEECQGERVLRGGDEVAMGDTVLRFATSCNKDRTNALMVRKVASRQLREELTIT